MKIKLYAACVAAAFSAGLPGAAFAEDAPPTVLIDPEATEALVPEAPLPEALSPDVMPVGTQINHVDMQVDMIAIVDALVAESSAAESSIAESSIEVATNSLSDDDLSALRGGEALAVSKQTLTAVISGSVLNGNYTAGAVSLSDNALSNFNGFGNFVINTGAQNNLQSGMNLTVNVNN